MSQKFETYSIFKVFFIITWAEQDFRGVSWETKKSRFNLNLRNDTLLRI